jgi:pyridinium-3,5-bisthiocarboxylic acid mononucleotide nickel chelatase
MTDGVWIDAAAGASGDMLLAALWDLGVPAAIMAEAAAAVAPVELTFWLEQRQGFAVARAAVSSVEPDPPHRTWASIRTRLAQAALAPTVQAWAEAAFGRLAVAEGRVHGVDPDSVHFHEVGAHDSIGDIVGVCAGFAWLQAAVTVGPIALGGGTVTAAHGVMTVPGPAVLELLRGTPAVSHGGPVPFELCTPTGAALLLTVAAAFGDLPPLTITGIGSGCGSRELPDRLGALRLVQGQLAGASAGAARDAADTASSAVVLATNVDDLDPRLWPRVLTQLLAAGAADAWLTPILMKKGRPAHTLHVLAANDPVLVAQVQRIIFTETTAIGLRTTTVAKTALARELAQVEILGQRINIKIARHNGQTVNAQPEYEDIAAAATALGLPVKDVLARAAAAHGVDGG